MKRKTVEPGSIRVWQCARGRAYPTIEGHVNIAAWSRGASPWSELSPFKIGPVQGCSNFESFWQAHKVWKTVTAQNTYNWKWPAETHVDDQGEPNERWHKWHAALLANPLPVRRPNGREIPLYAWWKGQKMGIVEARKQIYIPVLQALYRDSPVYVKLLELVRGGQSIVLIEPDATPFAQPMVVDLDMLIALQSATTLKAAFPAQSNDGRYFPYGHGYVIALTLLEDLKE